MFRLLALLLLLLPAGCSIGPTVRPTAAQLDAGGPLPRPVIVVGGYLDPGLGPNQTAERLIDLTHDLRIASVSPGFALDMEGAANKIVEAVDAAFPTDEPKWTTEVDVVAISMGGPAARLAAAPGGAFGDDGRRLRIGRMYSIASPHVGARMADRVGWADLLFAGRQMRTGSGFYRELERREKQAPPEEHYPIVQYAKENDLSIGPGSELPDHLLDRGVVIWIDTPRGKSGHMKVYADETIRGDIARRLLVWE